MLVIDGIIFSLQRHGGISVYFQHLLQHLSNAQKQAALILDEPLMQECVAFKSIIRTDSQAARFLERYRSCRTPSNSSVFHSSYYRLPSQSNLPSVVTVHDFIYERFKPGVRQWVHTTQKNKAIRAAQAVICVSEATKQDLLELVGEVPGQQLYVIHNGVSQVFRNLNLEPNGSVPYVLFVGQRSGYKNFHLVLKAMEYLPDFQLHCVGGGLIFPGELKGVPDSVARRVKHLGFVSDDQLNYFYNQAVCLIYPSSYEGFGIPVLEAMRAGCPVLSADCKAVREVGRDALMVISDIDSRGIADAVHLAASSERLNFIQKGYLIAKEYSWDNTHRRTLDVYSSLGAW
jgi:mannosyltransferase